jgi:hypothetical protein
MISRLLIFGLFLLSSGFVSAQNAKNERLPIIDVHMHCYNKDPRWDNLVPNPVTKKNFNRYKRKSAYA